VALGAAVPATTVPPMIHHCLAAAAFATASLLAQQPPAAPAPQAPAAAALPAAGSPEAEALVTKALDKMKAYGRGAFTTSESNDNALLRGHGLPFGNDDTDVSGGWNRNLVWGESDDKQYLRANGRMLAKIDGKWKLRAKKLEGGRPAPFTLDPELLFTVLAELPDDARKVANVEAGEAGGKKVVVLSLALEGAAASEFAESGAVPGGGGGGFVMFGAPGMDTPENEYAAYVALFVEPDSGDLLRFATKIYEKNEMMGNVQIQVQGGGGDEAEAKDDEKEAPAGGPLQWKKGLPVRKPAKDESVTTYRADFKKLGAADAPALDDKAKALLRMQ
jgi:hypothetical protein